MRVDKFKIFLSPDRGRHEFTVITFMNTRNFRLFAEKKHIPYALESLGHVVQWCAKEQQVKTSPSVLLMHPSGQNKFYILIIPFCFFFNLNIIDHNFETNLHEKNVLTAAIRVHPVGI